MKFARFFISVVAVMVFSAGFAFADVDVNVENTNTSTATGGNATQSQDQKQKQDQQTNNTIRAALPEVGFTRFLNSGTPILGDGWKVYCPAVYQKLEVKKLEKMQTSFKASDLLPWNWSGQIEAKFWGNVTSKEDAVSCVCYWPKETVITGDDILGAGFHAGEAEQSEDSFFADAELLCKQKTGSSRVAMIKKDTIEGVTTGKSIGGSALTTGTNDAGTSGAAFVGGGMLGKNRTSIEERSKFKFLCMNDGPTMCGQSATTIQASQAKTGCDPNAIYARIRQLEQELKLCTRFCFNNLKLRSAIGNAYVELYQCTGDKNHLATAIKHYGIAEKNYRRGYDIKSHKTEAAQIIAQDYYNWAGAINVLNGQGAAMSFANQKHLERIPSGFAR